MIDTCIHHRWAADAEVLEHLDPSWQAYVGIPGSLPGGAGMKAWVPRLRYANPEGNDLRSAQGADGAPAGSSLELLDEQVLRPGGVERALLLFDRGMFVPANPNPFLAAKLVSAINDWNLDRWLSRDERLYGAVLVATQTPDEAAAEIRRVGEHPKIAGVLLATAATGKKFGHPLYDPIYRAATELDLPVILHRGGDAVIETPTGPAGGVPATFAEYATLAPFAVESQLISLIANGVFDKYPELRVLVVGTGVTWLPGLLTRLEQMYLALRREIPWVRSSPTEYVHRQVRISTYGLEQHGDRKVLADLIAMNPELEELLVYGSGYPSWDTAHWTEIEDLIPPGWLAGVRSENAERWLRWPGRPARRAEVVETAADR